MPVEKNQALEGVSETMLLPLYIRALESKRPDAMIKDEKAEELVSKLNIDAAFMSQMHVDADDQVTIVMRNRQFDRYARDFMQRNPGAVVVHGGCGLDTRFQRVDDGQVEWFDLDFPQVIEQRRRLIGGEGERYHLLACSLHEDTWLDPLSALGARPFLFLAEGVLMYFTEEQARQLFLKLNAHFPGAELVFDAFAPYLVFMNNLRISRTKIGARYSWGMKNPMDLERWGMGIRLLEKWYYLEHLEPRLAHHRWATHIPFLVHTAGIFRYRLEGES